MNMNYRAKQEEGDPSESRRSISHVNPSTSRQWANFKNPRIVRVSRTFGGKDRHSKVCTVRGLRDRRIRLSVPTAIQLYDLQDRLGLSQPSKVVDWLLDATKTEIDKLPPLQMPPGNSLFSHHFFQPLPPTHDQLGTDRVMSSNSSSSVVAEKEKWIASNDHHHQENHDQELAAAGYAAAAAAAQIQAQNFFPTGSNSLPFMNPYYHHLEPANYLSLSQFGNHSFPIQLPEAAADHSTMINYSSAAASGSSQLYFCPSAAAQPLPSMNIPLPYMTSTGQVEGTNTATATTTTTTTTDDEHQDPRQINHFQFLTSSSSQNVVLPNSFMPTLHLIGGSPIKSLSLNVNQSRNILHPQVRDNINQRQKEEGTTDS